MASTRLAVGKAQRQLVAGKRHARPAQGCALVANRCLQQVAEGAAASSVPQAECSGQAAADEGRRTGKQQSVGPENDAKLTGPIPASFSERLVRAIYTRALTCPLPSPWAT